MAQIHETFVTVDRLTYADGMFPLFRGQCGSPHDAVGGSQAVFAALIGDFSVVYIDDFVSDALQIAGDVGGKQYGSVYRKPVFPKDVQKFE